MLVKSRDLSALTHVGKMSRFTHFARHKILAARHFKLFCTPGSRGESLDIAGGAQEMQENLNVSAGFEHLQQVCNHLQVF